MAKAIAISLESPFGLAFISLSNFFKAMIDFMYGTRERANYTCAFAVGVAVLATLLHTAGAGAFMACSHDTLAGVL